MGKHPVHADAGQPEPGQRGGDQEVTRNDGDVVAGHLGAGSVTERQGEQKKADGRRRDHYRTTDVRHQPAQGDDFRPQGAEAFDENNGVEEGSRHRRIILHAGRNYPVLEPLPFRRASSASSSAMRWSRSARICCTSAASKCCGMCCGQLASQAMT